MMLTCTRAPCSDGWRSARPPVARSAWRSWVAACSPPLYLGQALRTPGIRIVGVADLAPARVRERLVAAGWPDAALAATVLTDDVRA